MFGHDGLGAALLNHVDTPMSKQLWGSQKESSLIQESLETTFETSYFCNIRTRVLTPQQCVLLMTHVDDHVKNMHNGQTPDDLKLRITTQKLGQLVGADTVQRLRGLMSDPEHSHKIILRRCAEHGKFLRFHLDHDARETMQVSD